MKRPILILSFLFFFQLSAAAGVSSAVLKNPLPDSDTLRSSLSANRTMIARFQSEYETLSKQQAQKPTKESSKKLENLKIKIAVLKSENDRFLSMLSESSGKTQEPTKSPDSLTGKDWVQMSQGEKELYIFSSMGALVKRDVLTMKPSGFYIEKINQYLGQKAEFETKKLDDILILSIYKYEPDTREALQSFKKIDPNDLQKLDLK